MILALVIPASRFGVGRYAAIRAERNILVDPVGVIRVAAVFLAEIAERETVEVPAVGGIAERTEVGVVRRDDERLAAGTQQAVEFLHGLDYVGDMLDHMNGLQFIEDRVAERVGKTVEVADYVGVAGQVPVNPDRARIFADAAADVESLQSIKSNADRFPRIPEAARGPRAAGKQQHVKDHKK